MVEEAWIGNNVSGWMNFLLKEKLKGLKIKMKDWNKEVYRGIEERVEKLMEDIKGFDVKGGKVG